MKWRVGTCSLLLALGALQPLAASAAQVVNQIPVTVMVTALTAGKTYAFDFQLFDEAIGGNLLFVETKSYKVTTSKKIAHLLGSVNPGVNPLLAEDFLQQVWVEVKTGTKVFPRIKFGPVPLAIGSQEAERLNGRYAEDFAVAEHTHLGGPGSEMDADTVDGMHADELAGAHAHVEYLPKEEGLLRDGDVTIDAKSAAGPTTVGIVNSDETQMAHLAVEGRVTAGSFAGDGALLTNLPAGAHTHAGADIAAGTVGIARLPTGTGATQVAVGNHNHDAAYVNEGQASSVTSTMLVDGTIGTDDLAASAVTESKIGGTIGIGKISGTVPIAQLPVGTSAVTVAAGNHAHADLTALITALTARVAALEAANTNGTDVLAHFTHTEAGGIHTVQLAGANLQVVDGSGDTDGATNGMGNLIVGYNALRGAGDLRTGSHNLIFGERQNYSSYGGLVGGYQNMISAPYATASSGAYNTASGFYSSVGGGAFNTASGGVSSVSGGRSQTASGDNSSVSGGEGNTASGYAASVSGGKYNTASGAYSAVAGGGGPVAEYGNNAFGGYTAILGGVSNIAGDAELANHDLGAHATVGGGWGNKAQGPVSSVGGGQFNVANGWGATVSGGGTNTAGGDLSSVSGGQNNTASGGSSSVSGGQNNTASGGSSSVSGGQTNTASGFRSSVSGGQANTAVGEYSLVSGGYQSTASANWDSVIGSGPVKTYSVGGTIIGLKGSGLVLQNIGGNDLTPAAAGAFAFSTAVPDLGGYAVTIKTQPANPAQNCTVSNGTGTVSGAPVTGVQIVCPVLVNASATALGQTKIQLIWNTTGFANPTRFRVYERFHSAADNTLVKEVAGTEAACQITGLAPNTQHTYRVEGLDADGTLTSSSNVSATTAAAPTFPAPLSGLTATRVGSIVTLSWDNYAGATQFEVYRTVRPEIALGSGFSMTNLYGSGTSVDDTIAGNGRYSYMVVVYNADASLSASAQVSIDVPAGTLPGVESPILDNWTTSIDGGVVHVYWYASPGADAHHVYLAPEVVPGVAPPITPKQGGTGAALDMTGVGIYQVHPGYYGMSIPLDRLSPGNNYVAIEAVRGGYAADSGWMGFPKRAPAPVGVTGVATSALNPTAIDVSWDAVAGAASYKVYRLTSSTEAISSGNLIGTTTETTYRNTGLTGGTLYYYRVTAIAGGPGGGAESAPSDYALVRTLIAIPPLLNLPFQTIFPATEHLTWLAHNSGTEFRVYGGASLIPTDIDPDHLVGQTSLWTQTVQASPASYTIFQTSLFLFSLGLSPTVTPVFGHYSLAEVYPDGTESDRVYFIPFAFL